MKNENVFIWLTNWFYSQCDGDWEHMFGIKIETLDNPGWNVEISIEETNLQSKDFDPIKIERSAIDWIFCTVENGFFKGYCGPLNLSEVLEIFRKWANN